MHGVFQTLMVVKAFFRLKYFTELHPCFWVRKMRKFLSCF